MFEIDKEAQLEELVALYQSYDELRNDGILYDQPDVVEMCDRRMDIVQDKIIDLKKGR
jgi:hypothetical protein